jgi:hypothetical protein
MDKWSIKKGMIITYQQEGGSEFPDIGVIPFWKWASLFD